MLSYMFVSYENFAAFREKAGGDVWEITGRYGKKIEWREMRIL